MADGERGGVESIPRVYLVFNGPLGMSSGKMAAQAFQACQRLYRAAMNDVTVMGQVRRHGLVEWARHTTTVARVARTPAMWERVKAEVGGVVMVDEGYTEVEPGSETVFASWPLLAADAPKILSNSKVPLL